MHLEFITGSNLTDVLRSLGIQPRFAMAEQRVSARQRWRDHLRWSEDFSLVVGLTPVGRATVETLHLDGETVANLRRVLYAMGDHLPEESYAGDTNSQAPVATGK